jgi:hypothetical protein
MLKRSKIKKKIDKIESPLMKYPNFKPKPSLKKLSSKK